MSESDGDPPGSPSTTPSAAAAQPSSTNTSNNMAGHGHGNRILMVTISYIVNIVVAGTLGCLLFFKQGGSFVGVYGPNTPSRQILSCLYLSIAIVSVAGLVHQDYFLKIALVLFPMQIVYKLLTLIAVEDRKNPVPYANLAISILHTFSLWQSKYRGEEKHKQKVGEKKKKEEKKKM